MEKEFTLPAGYLDKDGNLHKTIVVTPVTGRVRREIGEQQSRRSAHSILNTILARCVKSIGPYEKVNRQMLDELLTGDRWFCAMMIRKFKGDLLHAEEQCSRCNETTTYEFPLEEYDIKELEPDDCEIIDIKGRPHRVFSISSDEHNVFGKFRYMTGDDERAIASIVRKNPFDAEYSLWTRCLVNWTQDGQEIESFFKRHWDEMWEPVIVFVEEEFNEAQPGPRMVHFEQCPVCGSDVSVGLENTDFLFSLPGATKKGYSLR